jgi:hypothetical protein
LAVTWRPSFARIVSVVTGLSGRRRHVLYVASKVLSFGGSSC